MTDTLWRVYAWEWVVVHSSSFKLGPGGRDECEKVFTEQYEGRVRDKDWHIKPASGPERYWLELRLPNLQGEFKDKTEALELQISLPHSHLVEQGSPEERELLDYGRRMLRAT